MFFALVKLEYKIDSMRFYVLRNMPVLRQRAAGRSGMFCVCCERYSFTAFFYARKRRIVKV